MSASSAVPATPGGFVLPNVEKKIGPVTVSTVLELVPQLPAASFARTRRV